MVTSIWAAHASVSQSDRRSAARTLLQFVGAALVGIAGMAGASSAVASVLVQSDFGTTEGSSLDPFSSQYTREPFFPSGGDYWVAKNAGGQSWSSPMGDWGGVDHTDPGTGYFLVVDGAEDSSLAILSYAANTVAGYEYTLRGWVQIVQAWDGPDVSLNFRVNGEEKGTFAFDGTAFDDIEWVWREFAFTYTAVSSGPTVFALHDNVISLSMNDFGLDDLVLSTTAPSPIPEPAALVVWCVLGCLGASVSVSKVVFRSTSRRSGSVFS